MNIFLMIYFSHLTEVLSSLQLHFKTFPHTPLTTLSGTQKISPTGLVTGIHLTMFLSHGW